MPHPIYGPPEHRLATVEARLEVPTRANDYWTRLHVVGRSTTKRAALWTVTEAWQATGRDLGLVPVDALHLVALIALQERPRSQAEVEYHLRGADRQPEAPTLF